MDVTLVPAKERGAPAVLILERQEENVRELLRLLDDLKASASLAIIGGFCPERDLTPWPAPAAWKGTPDFSGGADAFLERIEKEALPEIRGRLGYEPSWHGIAGYSLAGLFAAYALYKTDTFSRAASVSGSLWYDGFADFALGPPFAGKPERVYLSLGSKESRAGDKRMARVKEKTQTFFCHCEKIGIRAAFETNPGNHFQDPAGRLAKGIRWLVDG